MGQCYATCGVEVNLHPMHLIHDMLVTILIKGSHGKSEISYMLRAGYVEYNFCMQRSCAQSAMELSCHCLLCSCLQDNQPWHLHVHCTVSKSRGRCLK